MIGKTAYALGVAAESMVQKKLWTHGYSVQDVSKIRPYDLLVDGKYKVEVKYSSFYATAGKVYWNLINIDSRKFDILAIVLQMPTMKYEIFFSRNFPVRVERNLVINSRNINSMGLEQNPKKVFIGEPKKIDFTEKDVLILKGGSWYTLAECEILLERSQYKVRKLVESKALRGMKIGKGKGARYSIKGEWVIEYLASHKL